MVYLFRATMYIIDDLSDWSIFSHVRIVLKGWPFGPKLFSSFLFEERIIAQKYSREMGNFWSTCPETSIKVISEYHDFRDLCFWSLKGFWQAWSCSKSWCIPNYRLLVPTKIYFFVCLTFEEFEKKFLNREFYGQMLEQAWSNGLFDFFKNCALQGTKAFYSNGSKVKMSVC